AGPQSYERRAGGRRPGRGRHRGRGTDLVKGKPMSEKDILYEAGEGTATITLNRPERMNALTHALETEMHGLFDKADADRSVKVIILTGNGPAFCAGYDQGQTGKSGTRHSDPKGKSHAEFIEHWPPHDAPP